MNKEFKPFQQILAKQGVWRATHFSHKREDGFIVSTSGGVYNPTLVLPYEGNEELLGTDKSPKPKRWRAERGEVYWLYEPLARIERKKLRRTTEPRARFCCFDFGRKVMKIG